MSEDTAEIGITACIILARGGSVGVPRKNLQKVGGVSLIARSIRAANSAKSVDHVFVSTDHPEIAAEAEHFGARIINRPDELADSTASSEAGWLHAADHIATHFGKVSRLVFLQCTSPFTTGSDIEGCLTEMQKRDADCALSVFEDHSFLWGVDQSGHAVGQNHDYTQPRLRRQDLAPQYCESGAIYVAKWSAFVRAKNRFCGSVALYPVAHPRIEIDTPQDLKNCQLFAATRAEAAVEPIRLANIRALAMDFDGVHTDDRVITDQNGGEAVVTSRSDGMGLAMMRRSNKIHQVIVSKERNPVVQARADKLGIEVKQAVDDKVQTLGNWLKSKELSWDSALFVGNDINDIDVMKRVGLSACPNDAHPEVLKLADWVIPKPGGHGAIRAVCDAILNVEAAL